MHVLMVCYNQPADPAAFDSYYTSTHAPLAEKIPGMTSFTYRHCASLDGSQPPYYLLAELSFPSQEALGAGLSQVAGKLFRIGHLGDLNELMLLGAIAGAEMAMRDVGIEVELGSGVGAAQAHFRGGMQAKRVAAE